MSPVALPDAAATYWRRQQNINASAAALAGRAWQLSGGDTDRWLSTLDFVVAAVSRAQAQSAILAGDYVADALADLDVDAQPRVRVNVAPLVGRTGSGLSLRALYANLPQQYQSRLLAEEPAALTGTTRQLQASVQTAISDAGRASESLHITVRPQVGYVRMLVPPSCSRCVVQAGKYFKWNAGFKRHPRCDCRHVPASESTAGDMRVNAKKYFRSLPKEQQDNTFGVSGAQAIRDGANITQVINADQGMRAAQVYGRNLTITDQGVTKRGFAGQVFRARNRNAANTPRLMPESIYQIAEDRNDAIRLLRLSGYVKPEDAGVDDIAALIASA
jgi:hypothetical protein